MRVHTGVAAAASASALNALAYTVGQDIVFGSGQYAPQTPGGQRLLAHELVHTLQQSPSAKEAPSIIPGGPAERATESAAQAALAGRPLPRLTPTAIGVARQASTHDPAQLNDKDLVNEITYVVNDLKSGELKPGTENVDRKYLRQLIAQFYFRVASNPGLLGQNQYLLEAANAVAYAPDKPEPKAKVTPPVAGHTPSADDQFDLLTQISEEFGRSFAGAEADKREKRLTALFSALEPDYAKKVDEAVTSGKLRQRFQDVPAGARKRLSAILAQRKGGVITLRPGVLGRGSKRLKEWDYYIVREGVSIDAIAGYLSTDPALPGVLADYNHLPHDKALSAGSLVYFQASSANRPEAGKQIREDLTNGTFIQPWGGYKVSHSGDRNLHKDNVPLTQSEYESIQENEREQAHGQQARQQMAADKAKHLKEDVKLAQEVPNSLLSFFFPTSGLYYKDKSSLIQNPYLRFQYQTLQAGFSGGTNLYRASGAVAVGVNLLPLAVLDAAAIPEVIGATETGSAIAQGGRGLYFWAIHNPRTTLALITGGVKLANNIYEAGGPKNYLNQVTSDPATFLSQVIDIGEVFEGNMYDQGSSPKPSAGGSAPPVDEPPVTAPTGAAQPRGGGGGSVPVVDEPTVTAPAAAQQKTGGGGTPPSVDELTTPRSQPTGPSAGPFGLFARWKALRLSGAILKGAGEFNPPEVSGTTGRSNAPRPAIVQPATPDVPTAPPQPTTPAPQVKVTAPAPAVDPDVATTQTPAAPAPAPAPVAPVQQPAPVVQVPATPAPAQTPAPVAPVQQPAPVVQVPATPAPAQTPAPVKTPAPRRRVVVVPAVKQPAVQQPVVKPTKPQVTVKQPQAPAAPKQPAPAPVSSATISVGEDLTVPYGGALVRAQVSKVTATEVTVRYETKSRRTDEKRPGAISETMPLKDLEQKIASGQVIRWTQERKRLMANRPPYAEGQVEAVWAREAAKHPDGKVFDPHTGEELHWDRTQDRNKQWHMGHIPGEEYAKLVDRYVSGEITLEQFMAEYQNPDNYYPEHPTENLSHRHEQK